MMAAANATGLLAEEPVQLINALDVMAVQSDNHVPFAKIALRRRAVGLDATRMPDDTLRP